MEMTRHIRPLYVKAPFNGKSMSKVLVDNGSAVNVMSLRIVETKRRRVRGMNSLYFPLSHHTYIYKKVKLYIR